MHSLLLASQARQVVFGPVFTHFTLERRQRTQAIEDRIVFRFGVRSHCNGFTGAVSSGDAWGLFVGIWIDFGIESETMTLRRCHKKRWGGCVCVWDQLVSSRYQERNDKPCALVRPF